MQTNLDDILLACDATVRDAIACINSNECQIALVLDTDQKLVGTITDGDVRRALLNGCMLEAEVVDIMNKTPTTAYADENKQAIQQKMMDKSLRQIPILDAEGKVIGVETLESLLAVQDQGNWVFLMAGGLGTRLRPLTETVPKPMLNVGNKPLLQTIIEGFVAHGFRKFCISVNYKADMLMDYFGDGKDFGVEIIYLKEDRRLGTAGALGLLSDLPDLPMIMMNGDILTKVNYDHLLNFHAQHSPAVTMCVREYDFQIPYGVVEIDEHRMRDMVEKPVQSYFVNAGIYVLEPEVVKQVSSNSYVDMPQLIQQCQKKGRDVAVFPVHEYWLDIGRMDDFDRAQLDIRRFF
jgi:dTDP-glucose pyrophosphorylase